ncbi:hypothetical protein Ciccas_012100, partial [Cichlidogyrus casuarinus]
LDCFGQPCGANAECNLALRQCICHTGYFGYPWDGCVLNEQSLVDEKKEPKLPDARDDQLCFGPNCARKDRCDFGFWSCNCEDGYVRNPWNFCQPKERPRMYMCVFLHSIEPSSFLVSSADGISRMDHVPMTVPTKTKFLLTARNNAYNPITMDMNCLDSEIYFSSDKGERINMVSYNSETQAFITQPVTLGQYTGDKKIKILRVDSASGNLYVLRNNGREMFVMDTKGTRSVELTHLATWMQNKTESFKITNFVLNPVYG